MNPYGPSGDPFMSNADQAANSFSNPMNMAHMAPGWGMNPAYQTPSYDAPYRPAYSGPNPYASYQKPGFFGSASRLFNPFHQDPTWGNPYDHNRSSFDGLATRPIDGGMNIMQNYVMPTAAMWATNNAFTRAMGRSIGSGIGSGVMQGLGFGGRAAGVAGSVGGFAGGFLGPLAAGLAVANGIDATIFQPYNRVRAATDDIRNTFSGITMPGNGGSSITGRGFSRGEASRIGSSIDSLGMMDSTFSTNQYHAIASMGMKTNLFDDVSSGAGVTSRVSSIASQIKTILAISKDPNIQTAIEELSKLKMGGASVAGGAHSQAMSAYSSIGMNASAAGVSVQRMMSTVGAQGQYMFQMNGMTPYLGQIAASNAFAGFASAHRTGLLSDGALARMGGTEGATQSAVAAQLTGQRTAYNMMGLAVKNMTGASTNGFVGTASAYGAMAARNPMGVAGQQLLHGDEWLSRQSETPEGFLTLEKGAIEKLRTTGQRPTGPNGTYDPAQVAIAMQSMGATPAEIQAYARLRQSQTNSTVVDHNVKAFRAQTIETVDAAIDQAGARQGLVNSTIKRVSEFGKSAVDSLSFGRTAAEGVGDFTDNTESLFYKHWKGVGVKDLSSGDFNKQFDIRKIKDKVLLGKDPLNMSKVGILESINTAAKSGGPGSAAARELLEKGFDHKDAKDLLVKFLKARGDRVSKNTLEDLEKSSAPFDEIAKMARGNVLNSGNPGGVLADDAKRISEITGTKGDLVDNLKILGEAQELFATEGPLGLKIEDALKDGKYKELAGVLNKSDDKVSALTKMVKDSAEGGYRKAAKLAGSMSMSVEEMYAAPTRFSSDQSVVKAIIDSKGDRVKLAAIRAAELSKRNGGSLRGMSVLTNDYAKRDELNNIYSALDKGNEHISNAKELSKSEVNWGSLSSSMGEAANVQLAAAQMNLQAATINAKNRGIQFSAGNSKPAN